jgi:tetratricopeptide (TPR) repeat protein
LDRLGEQEEGSEQLLKALSTLNSALEVWTREDFPFQWALAQSTTGWILLRLGERDTTSTSCFENAIAACRKALEVQTEDESPFLWAITQQNIGGALFYLGKNQNNLALLMEAESAFSLALKAHRSLSAERSIEGMENNLRIVGVHIQDSRSTAD